MVSPRRVFSEKRGIILPLMVAASLNVAVYGLAVYPLARRAESSAARLDAARGALAVAERDARGLRTALAGKQQADAELRRFYTEVLPGSLAGARRITYARLAQLAEDANLTYERSSYQPDESYEGRLRKLEVAFVVEGEYAAVRRFVHRLETAPEFVVVEDVTLVEGQGESGIVTLTLRLATYYLPDADGQ